MNHIYHQPLRRLLALAVIFTTFILSAEEQSRRGWHIVNTTLQPISVAWYESAYTFAKESSFPFSLFSAAPAAIPIGLKRCISTPATIAPGATFFMEQWSDQDTDSYKQLIITQQPALLTPTVSADIRGVPNSKELFVFDESTHEDLKKPFLEYIPTQPKLYVGQPRGTHQLIGRISNEPFDAHSLFLEGWHLTNCASKPLYFGWYQVIDDHKSGTGKQAVLGKNQSIVRVEPQETMPLTYPLEGSEDIPYKLISSFDQDVITHTITHRGAVDTLPRYHRTAKKDLKEAGTHWRIFDEEGMPSFIPHTQLLHLINTLGKPVYCAFYYTYPDGAHKYGPQHLVTEILPQRTGDLQYPEAQSGTCIQLFVSFNKQDLQKKKLSAAEWHTLCHQDFTNNTFLNWYVDENYLIVPHRYNPTKLYVQPEYGGLFERLAKRTLSLSRTPDEIVKGYEEKLAMQNSPYGIDAEIVLSRDKASILTIPSERNLETEFLDKRNVKVRKALNELLGEELYHEGDTVPTIALVFTGGGYRAMIETIGFIEGAADTQGGNIFDCCSYMMGLSGSTWAINPLVASGLSPEKFAEEQKYKVGEGGVITLHKLISNLIVESPDYLEKRYIQSRFGQFCGPIGLYGHALSHALLSGYYINGRGRHTLTLSDLRTNLQDAQYPLPINVVVDPGNEDTERLWYEFSPFYFGTAQEQGSWINTKLLGSIFSKGSTLHPLPEYPLAYCMGIWGSAFALSPEDIAKESVVGGFISRACSKIGSGFGEVYKRLFSGHDRAHALGRATAGTLPNYNYQREGALERVSALPVLRVIDGGITKEGRGRHNFASIPALWRNVDILIMCDSQLPSTEAEAIEHLIAADEEAKRQRLPFPNLTRSTLHKTTLGNTASQVASLFIEKGAPTVVYIQAKNNSAYNEQLALNKGPFARGFNMKSSRFLATGNFSYTPDQYEVLKGLTKSIFIQSKDTIKQAIAHAVKEHKKKA